MPQPAHLRVWWPSAAAALACLLALWATWDAGPADPQPARSAAPLAVLGPAPPPVDAPDAGPASQELPDAPFNPHWMGGACEDDTDCTFAGGFCLRPYHGWPGGTCSRVCTGTCPQKRDPLSAATFCVPDPLGQPRGLCVARCALNLTPSGCRPGYTCAMTTPLHGGPGSERLTCVPDQGTPPPATACTRELEQRGIHFGRPDLPDAEARLGTARAACQLDTPVLLASPLHHVDWREHGRPMAENLLVSCDMALALETLSLVLADLDVVEVEHVGTYNCRGVAGSSRLSRHAEGRAIDVRAFERRQGQPISVQRHWNGADKERRMFLRNLVAALKERGVFRKILTPDADAQHADHLHLEL